MPKTGCLFKVRVSKANYTYVSRSTSFGEQNDKLKSCIFDSSIHLSRCPEHVIARPKFLYRPSRS